MLLEDKVAIVSGAGPGLGRDICAALSREGARLVVGDLDPSALAAIRAQIDPQQLGAAVVTRQTDITLDSDCQALVDLALRTYGRIDILVNDAYHGGDFRSLLDADLADWQTTADVNIWGTLRMTKAVAPHMAAQGHGRIIMIVTQGVEWVQAGYGAYTGSKAALAHFTKLLAAELGPQGVRVNGVFPGPLWGPALQEHLGGIAADRGVSVDTVYGEWAAASPLQHLVTPAETAGSVVFFASDLATWITGQALYVNAGHWMH
jgi:NAD(P)-dependent dehydrogenase (short-subunit alcohol dehydrogenase family)